MYDYHAKTGKLASIKPRGGGGGGGLQAMHDLFDESE